MASPLGHGAKLDLLAQFVCEPPDTAISSVVALKNRSWKLELSCLLGALQQEGLLLA